MKKTSLGFWFAIVAMLLSQSGAWSALLAAEEAGVVGRVRLTEVRTDEAAKYRLVLDTLEGRFAPPTGRKFADQRLISLRPRVGDPGRYEATIYDYRVEHAFNLLLDKNGAELQRKETTLEQEVSDSELHDAATIVADSAVWGPGVADGTYEVYPAMPGVTKSPDGRRLVNVGIVKPLKGHAPRLEGTGMQPPTGPDTLENEVVSVYIPTGEIVRNASGAPLTSMASLFACGPNNGACSVSGGACPSTYHLEWPLPSPKWKLDIMHPACTTSIQSQGTGLAIQNVYYDNKLILKSADMPVLNVLYDNNACGPYRDWLYSEYCLQATGTDVASGFRVTTGNPAPTTLCESGVDGGNFKGVAIHDAGSYILITTQTNAGWYRYVMEWRLYLDGTIEPVFGFGATNNSCTCNPHNHHAYWRFEWALDGDASNQSTGIATAERVVPGTTDQWTPITTEGKFVRPATNLTGDWWRIKNPVTGTTYIVKPGGKDGTANGDTYGKDDYWVLAYNTNEINDPNTDTSINIDPWVNGESIGTTKRLVYWYHASYRHDYPGGDTQPCEVVGPRLEYSQPCAGTISLDKGAYGCSDLLNITVKDSDLVGAGTQAIAVLSTTETTPETVTLTENPAGSGTFTGSFPTDPGPAVNGDGKLSVTNGDSITVRYVDVSSCGTPNVTVEKTTIGDCQAPSITNVQASGITESSATISWTTNEPANSRVTYGTTIPPATVASDLATYGTTHSIALSGLPSCTTYRFGVSSADIAGNLATANAGGSYFAFSTKTRGFVLGPDNVESGAGSWTASGTAGSIWHVDTCQAHSPAHAWKAGAPAGTCPGTYGSSADTYLTSPTLSFGVAGHGYHLRFSDLYKTQGGSDLCTPQVSTDGGTTWTNLDQYSGSSGAWLARDYDLSAFTGANIKVRFWFHSDASTNDEGWYVDDIEISRASACSADLLQQSDSVTDACASGGAGNGNGVLDPGEEAVLSVTVSNLGILPATGVTASLSTSTPGVSITRATATMPDIAVGSTATTAAPHLAFSVGPSVPCGTLIDFAVVFTGNEGTWSSSFSALVGQGGSGTTTYSSSDVPRTIQDNATMTSTLTVPASGTITDVNAKLSLTHTFDGDLTLQLIAPTATTVLLSNRRGSSSDNYTNTIFDDQATTSIAAAAAPFTGTFKPEGSLAILNGQAAAGSWQLSIQDSATADTGTLTSWSLTIASTTPPTCTSCSVVMPTETLSLGWPAGSKTKLQWGAVPGAAWYTLYRGDAASLPALLNTGVDSCLSWTGSDTATPDSITQVPPAGGIHWFLVTAANAAGEGSAGNATAGPRVVNSTGPCP